MLVVLGKSWWWWWVADGVRVGEWVALGRLAAVGSEKTLD